MFLKRKITKDCFQTGNLASFLQEIHMEMDRLTPFYGPFQTSTIESLESQFSQLSPSFATSSSYAPASPFPMQSTRVFASSISPARTNYQRANVPRRQSMFQRRPLQVSRVASI
jgi:hypothetical protein